MKRVMLISLLLPSVCWAANSFSGDPNCLFVLDFESIPAANDVTVTASHESGGYEAWKSCDNSGSTRWRCAAASLPVTLAVDWGGDNRKIISRYDITAYSATYSPNDWTFQGYDGGSWSTLDTQTDQVFSNYEMKSYDGLGNTTAYEAYRLNISVNQGGSEVEIAELDLYGDVDWIRTRLYTRADYNAVAITDRQSSVIATAYSVTDIATSGTAKEGSASLDMEATNTDLCFISSANQPSGFVMKDGETNYTFSTTQWVYLESASSNNVYRAVWAKQCATSTGGSWLGFDDDAVGFQINFVGGAAAINTGGSCHSGSGRWYFVATTYDNSSDSGRLYIWDDTASSIIYNSTSAMSGGDPIASDADWVIGGSIPVSGSITYWDGLIDEMTVWDTALSVEDINDIRDGLYTASTVSEPWYPGFNVGVLK